MKLMTAFFFIFGLSMAHARVTCEAKSAKQMYGDLQTKGYFSFDLVRAENQSVISNLEGNLYISHYAGPGDVLTPNNSYIEFFNYSEIKAFSNYKPAKYKGFAKFEGLNSTRSEGLEGNMWGYLVVDVKATTAEFAAHYIFQAGDHVGGTVHFACKEI
ncbi:MAG: hypothetical protein AB7I27_03490 [Bacteriovoracaceae bacterium]